MSIYICFPGGKAKALTMSYDDGRKDDIRLVEIFNRHGIRGTFNINYGPISRNHPLRITPEQVKELYKGHEVATHALEHPTMERCPITEVVQQIMEDRKGLEKLTGELVRGHAYPNGSFSAEIKALLPSLGIAYARTWADGGNHSFDPPKDLYEWGFTCHHADPELMDYAKEFAENERYQYLQIMMVAGHSFEFDRADNWNVIEEFCAYMGGRDDIWYATNIEIADYLNAARSLQYSADHTKVYNPNARTMWVQNWVTKTDHSIYEVPGGAAVTIA